MIDQRKIGGGQRPAQAERADGDSSHRAEGAEKREVLQRLRRYRDANGLGCLDAVARRCRSKTITPPVLRDMLVGSAVLPITEWRKVGRALSRMEGACGDG